MHISDGVLPISVTLGTYVISVATIVWSVRKTKAENIPKTAVMTSAFFVASLIHVPLGPTSVHLLLPGIVGILLGPSAFLSIFLGLFLQSILFQFGGLTSLGANAVMMGFPALFAGWTFRLIKGTSFTAQILAGAFSGALATTMATLILALLLISAGEDFIGVSKLAFAAHLPVICIEAIISGCTVSFLAKVRPAFLNIPSAAGLEK
jgi:cobalt/nickel transport system permease protein